MKKSKQNKTQKNNNNVDSNEIARQIAIETIKDTEKFFQRIANFFSFLFIFSNIINFLLCFPLSYYLLYLFPCFASSVHHHLYISHMLHHYIRKYHPMGKIRRICM